MTTLQHPAENLAWYALSAQEVARGGRRGEPLVLFVEEIGALVPLVSLPVWLAFGAVPLVPAMQTTDLEPVSGFEPLACRLQEARPRAPSVLPAQMAQVIALTATATLG